MSELVFPMREFEERLGRIRRKMKDAGLNALILTRPQNAYYASGYKAAHFAAEVSELHTLVIPAEGEPRIMTRSLEAEATKVQWTKSPKLYRDHENPYPLLADILKESGNEANTIGVEKRFLRVSQLEKAQRQLPGEQPGRIRNTFRPPIGEGTSLHRETVSPTRRSA